MEQEKTAREVDSVVQQVVRQEELFVGVEQREAAREVARQDGKATRQVVQQGEAIQRATQQEEGFLAHPDEPLVGLRSAGSDSQWLQEEPEAMVEFVAAVEWQEEPVATVVVQEEEPVATVVLQREEPEATEVRGETSATQQVARQSWSSSSCTRGPSSRRTALAPQEGFSVQCPQQEAELLQPFAKGKGKHRGTSALWHDRGCP